MKEQAKVLKAILNKKSIQPAIEHVGFKNFDNKRTMVIHNMMGNVENFIEKATKTENFQGRFNDDKKSAV